MEYADIIVDISSSTLDKIFQYKVPEHLQKVLRIGMQVNVPFGKGGRMITGYVTGFSKLPGIEADRIKEISSISKEAVPVEGRLIALASWMAEQYGGTMIQALKTVLPVRRRVHEKTVRLIHLAADRETALEQLSAFDKKNQKARARLLERLIGAGTISYEDAVRELKATRSVLESLCGMGLIEIEEKTEYRDPLSLLCSFGEASIDGSCDRENIVYTPAQRSAVEQICREIRSGINRAYLLHGVTGSGKTEVYMGVIDQITADGGQAIVLIPEIALTYQTVKRFRQRYGDRVSIMNSRLSAGERYDQSMRAARGDIDVMIGPRSALFTPFRNLKLIVVDEEHESTYKSETVPRYNAVEAAVYRGNTEKAAVILGSATPSVESYYKALNGEYHLLELPERIGGRAMPVVHTVDMRKELQNGNHSIISSELDCLIRKNLSDSRQIMLFLNRRGYAGFVSCRECGYVIKCSHCDVSMSHHIGGKLICHYCGSERQMPKVCPECGSRHIGSFRAGTQQVEELVKRLYPQARVLRMDMDTTRSKNGHSKILAQFEAHKADILIGTQMIVKGHDFPGVTLVGILAADLSLYAADFRSGETTFQLLTQAAGRAGRGDDPGEVVIQTYSPEHYAVKTAAVQDYKAFYEKEIVYRELMEYPPAAHLLGIQMSCADEELLDKAAGYLKRYGDTFRPDMGIRSIGPAVPPVAKIQDVYRKVLYYKHSDYGILIQVKNYLEAYRKINKGFRKINIIYTFE